MGNKRTGREVAEKQKQAGGEEKELAGTREGEEAENLQMSKRKLLTTCGLNTQRASQWTWQPRQHGKFTTWLPTTQWLKLHTGDKQKETHSQLILLSHLQEVCKGLSDINVHTDPQTLHTYRPADCTQCSVEVTMCFSTAHLLSTSVLECVTDLILTL